MPLSAPTAACCCPIRHPGETNKEGKHEQIDHVTSHSKVRGGSSCEVQ